MWLVTVDGRKKDGRQKGYSEDITVAGLAEELIATGAYEALNFDGGGSSTLAVASSDVSDASNPLLITWVSMPIRLIHNP